MYQDECERRMRPGAGGGSKDSRGSGGGSSSSSLGRDGRSRDADRASSSGSSYRDRDGGRSQGPGSSFPSYQSGSRAGAMSVTSGGAVGPALPLPVQAGPQPLMAQQFTPNQPRMGLMGHSPFQFAPPPAPTAAPTRK